jgi:hypothetical protein
LFVEKGFFAIEGFEAFWFAAVIMLATFDDTLGTKPIMAMTAKADGLLGRVINADLVRLHFQKIPQSVFLIR